MVIPKRGRDTTTRRAILYHLEGCPRTPSVVHCPSMDSPDTLDILRLSMDANLYNTPLAEYPQIPRILWTSLDYPWMPAYIIPPWQSIHRFPGYSGHPRIPWMPTYTIPPWQSIHGFPGYSGHPQIIRGCQPI